MTTPPFNPLPCATGAGGDGGFDVEQNVLCEINADGTLVGTALAVWTYDDAGNPVGPPTFVDPITGDPYVVTTGVLQPCAGDGCGAPVQFCFTSTAPVDQPGRMYDATFQLAQGFNVQAIVKDLVETPVNITWQVTDPDATQFVTDLQTAIQSQFAGQTVTVTPSAVDACTGLATFAVHIECLRIDQSPPTLLQLKYNSGKDAIINPAFLSTPGVPDNGQASFLGRQDAPATGPAAGGPLVDCTSVTDVGWSTNDRYGSFEGWGLPGNIYNTSAGTTPTPRGTSIQEINSWGSGPAMGPFGDNPNTIWQTFTVPAAGNFRVKVVVGGRAGTEAIGIKLSTGDVNDAGIGDVINTTVNAGRVTTQDSAGTSNGAGGPAGPWTTYDNTVPLAAGTYTMAFTGPPQPDGNPSLGNAFGGLFTDMRVYQDAPNTLANFTNDDVTCTVPVTSTSSVCEYWAPRCAGGDIVGWYNVADGLDLTNAEFWAQVPAPTCCPTGGDGGSSSSGNLVHTYLVCGTLNGEQRTMSRVVVSDQSGGIIADTFVDTDGAPVTPDTWQPGDCSGDSPIVGEFILCDDSGPFVRKLMQNAQGGVTSVVNVTLAGAPYTPVGTVVQCAAGQTLGAVCWNTVPPDPFSHTGFMTLDGNGDPVLYDSDGSVVPQPYALVICPDTAFTTEVLCDFGNANHTFVRHYIISPISGQSEALWDFELDGSTLYVPVGPVGVCSPAASVDVELEILCDLAGGNAVPFLRSYVRNSAGGIVSFTDNTLTGAPFVPGGPVAACRDVDTEVQVLCDVSGAGVSTPFLRRYSYSAAGLSVGVSDTALDGSAYTPTGTVGSCARPALQDVEVLVLCDSTPTRFLRHIRYAPSGVVLSVTNTTLDGTTAFAPVGAVGTCTTPVATDFDVAEEILCDSNNTAFIRRFTFNSSTGAVTATVNLTLAGGAFVPVGAVGVCTNCCPNVVGNGCTNTGSGFYTAIRATNGTISLIDSVSGAAIVAGNIVPCPTDNTVRTLTAQARQVTNGAPWTPGADVTGTLTSLTVTGVSGLWDMVDANGTALTGLPAGLSLTWNADDDNTLTGPTSVTPQAGASVVAVWTQR